MSRTGILICGFGPIGRMLLRLFDEQGDFTVAGVVDNAPEIIGQDARRLAGLPGEALKIDASPAESAGAEIAIVCAASSMETLESLFKEAFAGKMKVLTTCEEMVYPFRTHAEASKRLDEAARANDTAILGCGINPGFLMDYLPAVLSGLSRDVSKITVWRQQDATPRRARFREKIGAGLSPDAFETKRKTGTLRHVGLTESLDFLCAALGWKADRVEETLEIVPAETDVFLDHFGAIPRGFARGVRQTGRAIVAGRCVAELNFLAAVGERESFDRVRIDGNPVIDSTITGGVHGDAGTCSAVLNTCRLLHSSQAKGLLTALDLPFFPGRGI